jgi:hypothetical protein
MAVVAYIPLETSMTRRIRTSLVVASSGVLACAALGCSPAAPEPTPPGPLQQVAYLKASNPGMSDHFGEGDAISFHTGNAVAVSADGTTIAVGAQHEQSASRGINGDQTDDSAYDTGAVYVFTGGGASRTQQAYIKASNADSGDHFGNYVALSADGNTLAVAAYFEASAATGVNGDQADNSIPQAGAVYIFTRDGETWSQQAYLKASNTGNSGEGDEFADGDQFGTSLAISGDGNTVAVGAITEDSNAGEINGDQTDDSAVSAGAVYVYTRTGTDWTQQAYVKAPTPAEYTNGDMFGYSVSLNDDGNMLAVGVYDEGGSSRGINEPLDREANGSGAAYVFTRSGDTWSQQAYLKSPIAEGNDSWGISIALSADGNTLALGSADEDCLATGINPPGCTDDRESDTSAGAVAVFAREGATWTQQGYFKASNTGAYDWFGLRLALSGDGNALVTSAIYEASAGRGVNSQQDDDSAEESGAVYFFTRSGATWTQEAYVKASNADAYDQFGGAVAISGDGRTIVVGARGEDSAAAGVNGDQADNSLSESGAVYVFNR